MRKWLFFLLVTVPVMAFSQGRYLLMILPADKDTSFLTRDFSYRRAFTDTIERNNEMKNLLGKLLKSGFLEATFQNFTHDSSRLTARLLVGKQWEWAALENGNVDEVMLNRIGFRERLYEKKPFRTEQVNQLMESILQYCENNGYPFASVKLDSISENDEQLAAKIFLQKNKLITIDSLSIKGDVKIAKA